MLLLARGGGQDTAAGHTLVTENLAHVVSRGGLAAIEMRAEGARSALTTMSKTLWGPATMPYQSHQANIKADSCSCYDSLPHVHPIAADDSSMKCRNWEGEAQGRPVASPGGPAANVEVHQLLLRRDLQRATQTISHL